MQQIRCVSAAEARTVNGRDANEAVKVLGQMGGDCKVTGARFTGNTLAYSLSCPQMGFSAQAEMTLHGDTFDAVSTTTVGKTTSKNHTKGHRTGEIANSGRSYSFVIRTTHCPGAQLMFTPPNPS